MSVRFRPPAPYLFQLVGLYICSDFLFRFFFIFSLNEIIAPPYCGFVWLTIVLSLALAEEVTIYDRDRRVQERIQDGKIYDRDWGVKGYIEDGRVYDSKWSLEKRIEDGKVYDRNRNLKGHIEHGTIYDRNWNTKGYIKGENKNMVQGQRPPFSALCLLVRTVLGFSTRSRNMRRQNHGAHSKLFRKCKTGGNRNT